MKKVLHVIPSVGPLRGGPSVMVRTLAESLCRAGIETHVATTNDNGHGTLDVPCGVPITDSGVVFWYFPRQTRFYTFSWPLCTWLADHVADYDLVHIHALFSFATLPAAYWARRRGVPYAVRPLGTLSEWGMRNRRPWLKKLSFRLLEQRVIRHAALMHYTSEQERVEAERLPVRASRSVVIPIALPSSVGVTPQARARLSKRNRRVILFLSRIDEKKGLDVLLQAFAAARPEIPDTSLVIAGSGSKTFVDSLKAMAGRLNVADDVAWTGFVAGAEKAALLEQADVFVLPSYSENFGIAVIEAMSAALPVIVSDQVAIHREIAGGGAGVVVPCEVRTLAASLVELLRNPATAAAMGERGRLLVATNYSPDTLTRELIGVYETMAS